MHSLILSFLSDQDTAAPKAHLDSARLGLA
jgi:hypothetical protein